MWKSARHETSSLTRVIFRAEGTSSQLLSCSTSSFRGVYGLKKAFQHGFASHERWVRCSPVDRTPRSFRFHNFRLSSPMKAGAHIRRGRRARRRDGRRCRRHQSGPAMAPTGGAAPGPARDGAREVATRADEGHRTRGPDGPAAHLSASRSPRSGPGRPQAPDARLRPWEWTATGPERQRRAAPRTRPEGAARP